MLTDRGQAQKLFDAIFDPTDMVELRFIGCDEKKFTAKNPEGLTPFSRWFNSPGEAVYDWDWIQEQSDKGYHIYFGANPRTERSGKAESIQYARCLFVDIDNAASETEMRRRIQGLPEPTAIVSTGRGYHLYWRLTGRENDLVRWTAFQKGLIAHCNADPKIHDAPRIMRLPGTVNLKNGAVCEVVTAEGPKVDQDIAQVFPAPVNPELRYGTPEGAQAILEGQCLPPSRRVQDWLTGESPAPEGTRHGLIVQASVELVANGWPRGAAYDAVLKAGLRDGKDEDEIHKAFQYAVDNAATLTPSPNNLPREYTAVDGTQTILEPEVRPFFSNVVRAKNSQNDGKEQDYYKPVDVIADELRRATGGWPALAKGVLFYPSGSDDSPFRMLGNASQLFSFIYSRTSPRWVANKDLLSVGDHTLRSVITKQEFFEYLAGLEDDYRGISTLPHEPPMEGIWYAPITLPEPSGKLDELMARMNGETPLDNDLIKAMFATAFWGGPCGARPMFILRSRFGMGTGKTTTCDIAVALAGLAVELSAKDSWEQTAKKLLGESAMNGRIVRIDNVKGARFSSPEVESAITSPQIEGWRMYKGAARRMNDLTWIMTANSPNLSSDFASRSVVINIGRPAHADGDFKRWLDAFLAEHRMDLIADLLHFLAGTKQEIQAQNRDRFGYWSNSVLGSFPNANELAAYIASQRSDVDTEAHDAEEWAEHCAAFIKERFPMINTAECDVAIEHEALFDYFRDRLRMDLSVKGFKSALINLSGNRALACLRYQRLRLPPSGETRAYMWHWCTRESPTDRKVIRANQQYFRGTNRGYSYEGGDDDLPC